MEKLINHVFFAERNLRGAWAVYGSLGVRQYYGYTKKEAIQKYNEEANKQIISARRK